MRYMIKTIIALVLLTGVALSSLIIWSGRVSAVGPSYKDTDGDNPLTRGCIGYYENSASCEGTPSLSSDFCWRARGPTILNEFFAANNQGQPLAPNVCGSNFVGKTYNCEIVCQGEGFAGGYCDNSITEPCFGRPFKPGYCLCEP